MRVFLLFAVLCALCSSASSSLPQLRFGISYLPGRPERCGVLEQLAREYTAANVTITCFTSGQTNTFATRVLNSQNPEADILALLISDIGKYAELGALAEMTDVINDPAFLKTDFFDGTLAGSEYPVNSNRYYAAPFAADMLGFTYRKSVFAAHNKTVPGFLEDLPPLLEYFKSLPEFSGGAALYTCTKSTDSICSALRFTNALVADMFMFGNGGSLWNPDTYQITDQLDSDANVEAFQMAKRIFDAGVNQSVAIGYTDMVNNQVASMCGTPGAPPIALAYTSLSELATTTTCPTAMQDTGFFAIPFPKVNRASHVPLFSSSLVVPSRSPNVEAAKQFIAYMTSRSAQKRGLAWGFAVRKSVVIDPAFVFDGPTHALQSRLVFVQSLQRAKPYTVSLPMATQLLNIQDDFVVSFINTPTNQVTAASVKQSLSRLALQQQGLVDAYFPCGPVCPEIIRRSSAASYATLASHCIALFGCLCLAVAMFWFRNEPVMRASSIPFMSLILLGASGMFIGGIVMHSDDPTDGMCVAPLWTLHLGWFVVFMAILVKTYRIAAIFNRKVISKVSLTDAQLIRYFLLFVGLFFIYLLIWTFVLRPVSSIATSTSSGLKQQWTECDMGALETWDTLLEFLLLMCLAVMAFQVRAAPSAFHEAKALGIAVYNWVIIVALVFLLRSMGSGLEAKTLAADLHILLTAPVVLSCLFGPKFYAIYTGAAVTTDGSSSGGGKATGSGAAATPGNCVSQLNAPTSTASPRSKKFGPSASPSETSKKVPRPTLSSSSARPQSPQLDKPNVSATEGGKSVELSQVCVAEESNVESQQTAQYAFSVSSE